MTGVLQATAAMVIPSVVAASRSSPSPATTTRSASRARSAAAKVDRVVAAQSVSLGEVTGAARELVVDVDEVELLVPCIELGHGIPKLTGREPPETAPGHARRGPRDARGGCSRRGAHRATTTKNVRSRPSVRGLGARRPTRRRRPLAARGASRSVGRRRRGWRRAATRGPRRDRRRRSERTTAARPRRRRGALA